MKEVFLQFGYVIDLEWYGSNRPDDNLMVDIGYLPAMELKSTISFSQENVYNWSDEISVEEAQKRLEKAFFPFKQVYSYSVFFLHTGDSCLLGFIFLNIINIGGFFKLKTKTNADKLEIHIVKSIIYIKNNVIQSNKFTFQIGGLPTI